MEHLNLSHPFSEILTPEDFLKLNDSEKARIHSSRIIPPKLGDNHFGKIFVVYEIPPLTFFKRQGLRL